MFHQRAIVGAAIIAASLGLFGCGGGGTATGPSTCSTSWRDCASGSANETCIDHMNYEMWNLKATCKDAVKHVKKQCPSQCSACTEDDCFQPAPTPPPGPPPASCDVSWEWGGLSCDGGSKNETCKDHVLYAVIKNHEKCSDAVSKVKSQCHACSACSAPSDCSPDPGPPQTSCNVPLGKWCPGYQADSPSDSCWEKVWYYFNGKGMQCDDAISQVKSQCDACSACDRSWCRPPPPIATKPFQCKSDYTISGFQRMEDKGIVMDDTSYLGCSDKLVNQWPNSNVGIKFIRSNSAWRTMWEKWDDKEHNLRNAMMSNFVKYVKDNDVKVLLGQDATCNSTSDDIQWEINLKLMQMLGAEHVAAVAIGNEMDILYQKPWWQRDFPACMADLWDRGGYWKKFKKYVTEMDQKVGGKISVTSVWTAGFAHNGPAKPPFSATNPSFLEIPGQATVRSFVKNAYKEYGSRWIWTFNPYPIWTNPHPIYDPGNPGHCNWNIWHTRGPSAQTMVAFTRRSVSWLTGNDDDRIWAGEYGWSSPISQGMSQFDIFRCKNFTSLETFAGYYEHFLKWDLSLSEADDPADRTLKGLDKAFYFAMRDSSNGAASEYFGLLHNCQVPGCKVNSSAFPQTEDTTEIFLESVAKETEEAAEVGQAIEDMDEIVV